MTHRDASSWNVEDALAACPITEWSGDVWRFHTRKWSGDSAGGSLRVTGRYHRGEDQYPSNETWPALYTALSEHIALGEIIRHTREIAQFAHKRMSRLHLVLHAVLNGTALADGNAPNGPGLDDLCRPHDYVITHAIARGARARGAEALLVPTCTRFRGANLIVFPDLLHPNSHVSIVSTEDPDLYIDWSAV